MWLVGKIFWGCRRSSTNFINGSYFLGTEHRPIFCSQTLRCGRFSTVCILLGYGHKWFEFRWGISRYAGAAVEKPSKTEDFRKNHHFLTVLQMLCSRTSMRLPSKISGRFADRGLNNMPWPGATCVILGHSREHEHRKEKIGPGSLEELADIQTHRQTDRQTDHRNSPPYHGHYASNSYCPIFIPLCEYFTC